MEIKIDLQAVLNTETVSSTIAHEWGHILYLDKLGVEPLFFSVSGTISGVSGTTQFERKTFSNKDLAILSYCGPVAEGFYLGERIRISHTDAEEVRTLTKSQKARARKKATEFITRNNEKIKRLVEKTKTIPVYKGEGLFDFSLFLTSNQIQLFLRAEDEQL